MLGIAWAIQIIYAFPGQMTQDSFDHMREARLGVYSDAHPPIVDLLWKVCDTLVAGPFLFLVVQTVALLLGLYWILRRTFDPRPAAWWTFGIFAFPPNLTVMAVIWKDCVMAGALALGVVGLLSAARWKRLAGLGALMLATAFRYNAFGATLPLIVLLFQWKDGLHWLKRYALAAAAWLAVTLAAFGINMALTDKPMHYWQSSLAIYDIVGTYVHVDDDISDTQLLDDLRGTDLLVTKDIQATFREVYTTSTFYPILNDPKHTLWNLPINGFDPAPEAQRDAISRAWWHTVTTYPGAFLAHRFAVFADAIGIGTARGRGVPVKREFQYPAVAQANGLGTGVSPLQTRMTRWCQWFARHTPFFVPWVYGLLALLMIPLAWRQRDVLAIILSGIFMDLTLLPLVHSSDYRYSHWMVLTTILGVVILATRRFRVARPAA